MPLEEIVELVNAGDTDAAAELWNRVVRFIEQQARRYIRGFDNPRFDADDLIVSGYFAMLSACKHFAPERGGFLTVLGLYLKTAFADVAGLRRPKQRNDASGVADSLDRPLGGDASEEFTLLDTIPTKARSILHAENRIFTSQLHDALEIALSEIPPREAEALRLRYFHNLDYEKQGRAYGVSRSCVSQRAETGIWAIRFNTDRMRELSSFLYGEPQDFDLDRFCEEKT